MEFLVLQPIDMGNATAYQRIQLEFPRMRYATPGAGMWQGTMLKVVLTCRAKYGTQVDETMSLGHFVRFLMVYITNKTNVERVGEHLVWLLLGRVDLLDGEHWLQPNTCYHHYDQDQSHWNGGESALPMAQRTSCPWMVTIGLHYTSLRGLSQDWPVCGLC